MQRAHVRDPGDERSVVRGQQGSQREVDVRIARQSGDDVVDAVGVQSRRQTGERQHVRRFRVYHRGQPKHRVAAGKAHAYRQVRTRRTRCDDRVERKIAGALGESGVLHSRRITVEVPLREVPGDRTAQRMPAAEHFVAPDGGIRQFGAQQVVLVTQGLFETDVGEPGRAITLGVAGEPPTVDLTTRVVIPGGDVEVTGAQASRDPRAVLETVRPPVQRPEFDRPTVRRRRRDGVTGDALERARTLEDARLRDEDPVGVGRYRWTRHRTEPQVRQPITLNRVGRTRQLAPAPIPLFPARTSPAMTTLLRPRCGPVGRRPAQRRRRWREPTPLPRSPRA